MQSVEGSGRGTAASQGGGGGGTTAAAGGPSGATHPEHLAAAFPTANGAAAASASGTVSAGADAVVSKSKKSSKKMGRKPAASVLCQVPGCGTELVGSNWPNFYKRYRICRQHCIEPAIHIYGCTQRFCQQCGRFHPVDEFEGTRRSCIAGLARHASKRTVPGANSSGAGECASRPQLRASTLAARSSMANKSPTLSSEPADETAAGAASAASADSPAGAEAANGNLMACEAVGTAAAAATADASCTGALASSDTHHSSQACRQTQPDGRQSSSLNNGLELTGSGATSEVVAAAPMQHVPPAAVAVQHAHAPAVAAAQYLHVPAACNPGFWQAAAAFGCQGLPGPLLTAHLQPASAAELPLCTTGSSILPDLAVAGSSLQWPQQRQQQQQQQQQRSGSQMLDSGVSSSNNGMGWVLGGVPPAVHAPQALPQWLAPMPPSSMQLARQAASPHLAAAAVVSPEPLGGSGSTAPGLPSSFCTMHTVLKEEPAGRAAQGQAVAPSGDVSMALHANAAVQVEQVPAARMPPHQLEEQEGATSLADVLLPAPHPDPFDTLIMWI